MIHLARLGDGVPQLLLLGDLPKGWEGVFQDRESVEFIEALPTRACYDEANKMSRAC